MKCLSMHCLTASSSHCFSFANVNSELFPSDFFVFDSRRPRRRPKFKALNPVAVKKTGSGSPWGSFKKGLLYNCRLHCKCIDWDSEEGLSLEAEILEFMNNSKKPEAFPTKKELVAAGRVDLVHAILKKGGWLAYGWDLDNNDEIQGNGIRFSRVASSSSSSAYGSQPATSSGRPVETIAEESGTEDRLSRLEKERKNALALGFREKEDSISLEDNDEKDEWHHRTTTDAAAVDLEGSSRPAFLSQTSSRLSGFRSKFGQHRSSSGCDGRTNYNETKSSFQQLESEDQKSSADDLLKLYDDWEFQQTKIMNAQNRLRSIRAKLAVLEGKTELALRDAHKIVEEKQRRIDSSHKALQLLKTTCVVWPNKASEVLLTGSFDGWSTQRKMERSNSGMFSVCLHLCPGKYEIKFIVDGEWKIDPLRPIAENKNYKNNLLIVS